MKNYLILLISIFLFFAADVSAQLKPAESQYLVERGFLVNPSFEQGYKGWDFSGTCTKSLVSDVPYLNKSFKVTCINQTFSLKQETTSVTALQGQQGVYSFQSKATVDGPKVTQLAGGNRTQEYSIYKSTNYTKTNSIPYTVNSVSNGIEIFSDANITGEFIFDDVTVTLASDGFIKEDYDDVPVGTVLAYGSETLPDGYLLADGTCYLKSEYAALFSVIGTSAGECTISVSNDGFNLPDLTNTFLRGLTGGRSVFDTQVDATAVNGLGVVNNGNHNHLTGNDWQGFGIYGSANGGSSSNRSEQGGVFSSNSKPLTSTAGSHSHSLSGDSETRPENKAVVYIIKAKGRDTSTFISMKAVSPDMAGFLIWSAFDSPIEGHLKADGSCILKETYPDYVENVGNLYGDCTVSVAGDGVRLPDLITGNRYIRAAGGGLTVGQSQDDATAVNGLGTANDSHFHNQVADVVGDSGTSPFGGGTYLAQAGSVGDSYYRLRGTGTSPSVARGSTDTHNHTVTSSDSETRPITMALVPFIRMENRNEVRVDLRNGPKLGDCKWSLLDHADFNSENSGQWVRLEGQSISGSAVDTRFGISTLPNGVSNGAFLRMQGGNSAAMRTFQDHADQAITGTLRGGTANLINGIFESASGAFSVSDIRNDGANNLAGDPYYVQANFNSANVVQTANESRPKNIALNFYCLINY